MEGERGVVSIPQMPSVGGVGVIILSARHNMGKKANNPRNGLNLCLRVLQVPVPYGPDSFRLGGARRPQCHHHPPCGPPNMYPKTPATPKNPLSMDCTMPRHCSLSGTTAGGGSIFCRSAQLHVPVWGSPANLKPPTDVVGGHAD